MVSPHTRVPQVDRRPRRMPAPLPDPSAPVPLTELEEALIALRHGERMRRAERRSLHPRHLAEVRARLAAEHAVEQNLARGRAITRQEVRRATDPARFGMGSGEVRFPRPTCVMCDILRPVLLGVGALFSPFLAYFVLVGLFLL